MVNKSISQWSIGNGESQEGLSNTESLQMEWSSMISLFTIHYSLFTIHYSPFTIHHHLSLFTPTKLNKI